MSLRVRIVQVDELVIVNEAYSVVIIEELSIFVHHYVSVENFLIRKASDSKVSVLRDEISDVYERVVVEYEDLCFRESLFVIVIPELEVVNVITFRQQYKV